MKKKKSHTSLYIIIGLVVVIIASILVGNSTAKKADDTSFSDLKSVTYTQYKELFKSTTLQFIFVGRPGCGYCQMTEPLVAELQKEEGVVFNYLNTDTMTQADFDDIANTAEVFKGQWGTPTMLAVKDNKVINVVEGYREKSVLKTFIEDSKEGKAFVESNS